MDYLFSTETFKEKGPQLRQAQNASTDTIVALTMLLNKWSKDFVWESFTEPQTCLKWTQFAPEIGQNTQWQPHIDSTLR